MCAIDKQTPDLPRFLDAIAVRCPSHATVVGVDAAAVADEVVVAVADADVADVADAAAAAEDDGDGHRP